MHQDIFSAVIKGDILAVEDNLTCDGDPNLINEKGDPILVDFLINRHVEVVYMLLEAGTDDYKEIMELLLDYGADIDYVNPIFGTSLHEFAKSWCYMEMLEFLLERGANPNLATNTGWTPLHVAAYAPNEERTWLLLEYVARKDMKTCEGYTPLDLARRVKIETKQQVIELLM